MCLSGTHLQGMKEKMQTLAKTLGIPGNYAGKENTPHINQEGYLGPGHRPSCVLASFSSSEPLNLASLLAATPTSWASARAVEYATNAWLAKKTKKVGTKLVV
eukprot:1160185-Pelagomonas_calceolata.AAC.3